MALLIGLILLGLAGILFGALYDREHYWDDSLGRIFGTVCGALLLIIMSIVTPVQYVGSVARNAELEAFYEAARDNYAYAIDQTSDILTVSPDLVEQALLIPVEGSIERINVGAMAADRILEFRDAVTEYNEDLLKTRTLDKNPIVGVFYATPSEELQLIKIG